MNAAEIRAVTTGLLETHHDAHGYGPDPYNATPIVHPMAEGKYLSALGLLHRAGLLSSSHFENRAAASLDRLSETALHDETGTAWGLGFIWDEHTEHTPFLITTGIVVDGILDALEIWPDNETALALKAAAERWLSSAARLSQVAMPGGEILVPDFRPGMNAPITNAIAYWAGVMTRLGRDMSAEVEWCETQFVVDAGWPYRSESARFDLLHACYIARAFRKPSTRSEANLAHAVSQFEDRQGFCDKFDYLAEVDAIEYSGRATQMAVRLGAQGSRVWHRDPARAWSLGELLVVCGDREDDSTYGPYWKGVRARVVANAISCAEVETFPRHAMHLAHGLAATLAALRSQRS